MKMYDRELVRKRIENMIEQEKTVDIRQLTEVYGFSARWIQKVIKQKERRRVHG